jgi:hypothetical protein
MPCAIHVVDFKGGFLGRGFWLYVWEIATPENTNLYYVGRTGDSSSPNAQSPFNRMGQHLGLNKKSNALRRQLSARGVCAEFCDFKLVACGPILEEGTTEDEHRERRDRVAALEKALATTLEAAGYDVVNVVNCRIAVDEAMFAPVRDAFAAQFDKINRVSMVNGQST